MSSLPWEVDRQLKAETVRSVIADSFPFVDVRRLDHLAVRCDFLLASKIALGPQYQKDRIADLAQRDLLFYVLRDREVFPNRTGKKFYCCPKCTSKLYECVTLNVFRYIDNAEWKAAIESDVGR
jgi:hypothetical protein